MSVAFEPYRTGVVTSVFLCLLGCSEGDPLGRKPISGVVTLNGAPVAQGNISFEPTGAGATTSSGAVIVGGEYSIEQELGLPVGKYRVRINIPKPGEAVAEDLISMPGEPAPPPSELAPPEWNLKSQKTIEVTADGPLKFDFAVKGKRHT